ncbi:hypothetical protein [Cryptosporangium japonicum]|uniref:Uncharacterized protein n=1 Tax=Cryptosporangium japonicum TaxID=80872 RepID=A0ABP3EK60_9ACTN
MAIAEELIAGIISSVLAVLLVEIYLWLRRRYRQRALRWLVGTDTVSVITPVYPWAENAHPAGLLTTYDAIGLAHVLEACNRVGTVPVVTRSGESAENSPLDVVAIGGPSGNQVTSTFLKAYCPGFEILTDPVTGQLSYRCGDRVFTRSDDETFAFIVRLSPRETGLPGTALIAWGHSAVATASAGYYLAKYPQALRKVGKGSFFVAISVRWVLGYRSFDTRPIDLTKTAFAEPAGGSRPVPALGSGPEPAAVLSPGAGAGAGAGAVSGRDSGSASGPGADSGSRPGSGLASGPDSGSGPGLASEPGSASAGPGAGPEPVAEAEVEPRRRFGRSSRPTPAPRSSPTGRSRVAEALDDVRAETSAVTTDPSPTGTVAIPLGDSPSTAAEPPDAPTPSPTRAAKRPSRRTPDPDPPTTDRN